MKINVAVHTYYKYYVSIKTPKWLEGTRKQGNRETRKRENEEKDKHKMKSYMQRRIIHMVKK